MEKNEYSGMLQESNPPSHKLKKTRAGNLKCFFLGLFSLLIPVVIITIILLIFYPNPISNSGSNCQQALTDLRNLNNTLRYIKLKNWDLMLHAAIDDGDEASVKTLVELGANVNGRNAKSETPLHRAALKKNKGWGLKIITFLITNWADVFLIDLEGNTFLHDLVGNGTTLTPSEFNEISVFLISTNSSRLFNMPGGSLWKGMRTNGDFLQYRYSTPLQLAVQNLDVEKDTLIQLQRTGVNLTITDTLGRSPLNYAIAGGRGPKLLSDLIDLEANWNHLDIKNASLLHEAALYGNLQGIKFLLDRGLDVNSATTKNKDTPLHWVAYFGRDNALETVRFLLENGADPRIKNGYGHDALYLASRRYDEVDKDKIVQLLRNSQYQ